MEEQVPSPVRIAAVAQIISGLVNMFVMGLAWYFFGLVGGSVLLMCTMGLCPVGYLTMFAGCALFPLGVLELAMGIFGLVSPRAAAPFQKVMAVLECLALFVGALGSPIAGILVFMQLGNDEAKAYLTAEG